jgi:hypothetical protein
VGSNPTPSATCPRFPSHRSPTLTTNTVVHEPAGGEITLWLDDDGVIHIKTRNSHDDRVELSDEQALELSKLLARLVSESNSGE